MYVCMYICNYNYKNIYIATCMYIIQDNIKIFYKSIKFGMEASSKMNKLMGCCLCQN